VALRPITRPRVALEFYEITRAGAPRNALLVECGRCLDGVMKQHETFPLSAA
jgi:hypothetical protein